MDAAEVVNKLIRIPFLQERPQPAAHRLATGTNSTHVVDKLVRCRLEQLPGGRTL
jgi:hypothetical protein